MMSRNLPAFLTLLFLSSLMCSCGVEQTEPPLDQGTGEPSETEFIFGADLSYLNQILDRGGVYKMEGQVRDPYEIFSQIGTDIARFRLWHNPKWTSEIYGGNNHPTYNDLEDVEKSISRSKAQGMQVLLNFHFSDMWADPERQEVPDSWKHIQSLEVLQDSVYQYTLATLIQLEEKGLTPEYVQLGNETNCGMMYSNALENFPKLNVCEGNWANFKTVMASAVQAVKDSPKGNHIKIILHVADPVHVDWWFENLQSGSPLDYDIIGFSYYPLWHTEVSISQLSNKVAAFKSKFSKDILMLETAYPWTSEGNDSYTNLFGGQTPIQGFPFTKEGQFELLKYMSEEMIAGGAMGMIYWEPGWISADMKDLWGTGSSWENCTFFDFEGDLHQGAAYMKENY
ncbi:glycoside hydrolase family 53 protein [Mongoliibacter ruber]|uniref:Arabinogalactan endo-beta-1,4-galactanase n=1 Tax=Mongoliibacter ruber TaxID=1750599 RepID=A0A2T0WPB4_9BACT|nr:glycosyl hydrolase 53 family protein [Mongoliibacter ruber]PRY88548.1 arabinogalactan endo-1,4-beta-galactosidase [Mongoliibacter ruber]